MNKKISITYLVVFCLFPILFACQGTTGPEDEPVVQPASVNFYNESSFRVDLYKNLNPDYFDPTTLVCTISPGSIKKVSIYASADQLIGDTFYPRYKVLLADSFSTGTENIYVDAQRNLSNISFVIQNGKSYTKTIPQPPEGQLKFINGYIAVQNTGSAQVQILRADEMLYKLDNKSAYLNSGQNKGFYEIGIPSYEESLTVNQLKAFSDSYMDFPEFTMERGKLYSFTVTDSAVTGPVITNLNPVK